MTVLTIDALILTTACQPAASPSPTQTSITALTSTPIMQGPSLVDIVANAQANTGEVRSYVSTMDAWGTPQPAGGTGVNGSRTEITTVAGKGVHIVSISDTGSYSANLYVDGKRYSRGSLHSA